MINIDIIQNKEFSMGYPYNSSIDDYFKGLSSVFIDDFDISDTELQMINNHKIATEQFDKNLYSFANNLSTFIQEFNTSTLDIIKGYDGHIASIEVLVNDKSRLESEKQTLDEEFVFIEENMEILNSDLQQIEEMIIYYQSQLTANTILDIQSYIDNVHSDIVIIDESLLEIQSAKNHYNTLRDTLILDYIEKVALTSMYSFDAVILKTSFELWITRGEDYYKKLVTYYQDEYDALWSAGQSVMYDKNNEYVDHSKTMLENNAKNSSSELIKEFKFNNEKAVKEYTLGIIDGSEINPTELQNKILDKNIGLLTEDVATLETLLSEKQFAVESVISYNDFQDYNKYKELVQAKRHYIASNIVTICEVGTENLDINQYDSEIDNLTPLYQSVSAVLGQKTYWEYYYERYIIEETLKELRHQLDVLSLTKKGTINSTFDITDIENKIALYTDEKNKILGNIQSVITTKDKKTIEKIEINDSITLLNSNIFATNTLLEDSITSYYSIFTDRLDFFTQSTADNHYTSIKSIIDGSFVLPIITELQELKDYKSTVKWFDSEDQDKLFGMYDMILDILVANLESQWQIEFNHSINRTVNIGFNKKYTNELIIKMYARIIEYSNYKQYNDEIEADLLEMIDYIMLKIDTYIDLVIVTKSKLSIPIRFYDYDVMREFDFASEAEKKEDTMNTIRGYLMNNFNYVSEMNLSYKIQNTSVDTKLKIDTMWDNMENKYV